MLTALTAHERDGGHAATRLAALARSAIAPYARRIVDPPRLKFLSRDIPTVSSRSPVYVRMAAVTVRAATLAISPSSRRRYKQYARSRFGMVSTTWSVRHRREERGVQPLRPDGEALGVAARAEIPALAREREQVFVPAGVTADAGEAVLQDPTGEELVGHLRDDEPPGAVLPSEAFVLDRLVPPLSQGRQRLRETSESSGAYSAT